MYRVEWGVGKEEDGHSAVIVEIYRELPEPRFGSPQPSV